MTVAGATTSDAAESEALGKSGASKRSGRRHQRTTGADRLLLVLLIAASGWFAWESLRLIRADFQAMRARTMVFAWAAGRASGNIQDWIAARDSLLAAARTTPANPAVHDQLGMLYAVRGRDAYRVPEAQRLYYQSALRHQQISLALRPRHGWSWSALAISLNHLEPGSDAVWSAWRKAYAFTPYEPSVQGPLLEIGLGRWRQVPPDVKDAMRAIYSGAVPSVRSAADALAKTLQVTDWQLGRAP